MAVLREEVVAFARYKYCEASSHRAKAIQTLFVLPDLLNHPSKLFFRQFTGNEILRQLNNRNRPCQDCRDWNTCGNPGKPEYLDSLFLGECDLKWHFQIIPPEISSRRSSCEIIKSVHQPLHVGSFDRRHSYPEGIFRLVIGEASPG